MRKAKYFFGLAIVAFILINFAGCGNVNDKETTLTTKPMASTSGKAATTEKTETTQTETSTGQSATTGSTTDSSGTGDYEYSYAGFNPKPAVIDKTKWNLLLVNRNYILPEDYSPELAYAVKGDPAQLDARVAPYYTEMYNAAKADGLTLFPLSGYRRISTQKTNFNNEIRKYMNQGYDKISATQKAAQIILPPGCSEHNAGLAMDIISLDTSFENTKEFTWLMENAADYGFILRYPKDKKAITEITYEPWHWRYVGVEAAKAIKASGMCLEEYLKAN
jgi:D-alanyl-D-alanine carboxypeptidase